MHTTNIFLPSLDDRERAKNCSFCHENYTLFVTNKQISIEAMGRDGL